MEYATHHLYFLYTYQSCLMLKSSEILRKSSKIHRTFRKNFQIVGHGSNLFFKSLTIFENFGNFWKGSKNYPF